MADILDTDERWQICANVFGVKTGPFITPYEADRSQKDRYCALVEEQVPNPRILIPTDGDDARFQVVWTSADERDWKVSLVNHPRNGLQLSFMVSQGSEMIAATSAVGPDFATLFANAMACCDSGKLQDLPHMAEFKNVILYPLKGYLTAYDTANAA